VPGKLSGQVGSSILDAGATAIASDMFSGHLILVLSTLSIFAI